MVKNPPAMQETWLLSLSLEEPWEKGMTTHSSILAWRVPWTEKPGRLQSMGSQRVGYDRARNTQFPQVRSSVPPECPASDASQNGAPGYLHFSLAL